MAKETISSVTVSRRVREQLNAMHTELYAKSGANTTSTKEELNLVDGQFAAVTMATTPASGTCACQFTFKDANGVAVAVPVSGIGYISSSAGAHASAVTSVATLTNGDITTVITGKLFYFTTTAAGLLGITVTAGAGTYYVTFILPNGKLSVSTAIVVNA